MALWMLCYHSKLKNRLTDSKSWISILIGILGFVIFMMVRSISKMQKKEEEAPAEPAPTPADIVLLTEIRDALKK